MSGAFEDKSRLTGKNKIAAIILVAIIVCLVSFRYMDGQRSKDALTGAALPTTGAVPTFDDLLDAIEWVESKGDATAVGDNGKAIGAYQIHKIYVDEVNRILKKHCIPERFTYQDRWDRAKSRRMTLIHNDYWSDFAKMVSDMGRSESFVRSHKGAFGYSTEATKEYWLKVKARMTESGGSK